MGRADFDFGIIRRSLDALRRSGIPYELRTTVMRELHAADNLLELASMLSDDPAWYLQQFRESAGIIAGTGVFHAWSASDMRKLLSTAAGCLPGCKTARIRLSRTAGFRGIGMQGGAPGSYSPIFSLNSSHSISRPSFSSWMAAMACCCFSNAT